MSWIRKAVRDTVSAPADIMKGVFDGIEKAIDPDDWEEGKRKR